MASLSEKSEVFLHSVIPAKQAGFHLYLAFTDMDPRLRPPWMEVMLGMQEQFPVREGDGA